MVTEKKRLVLLIAVASLGYFVDIYDLLIFSIVRVQSLSDIGVTNANLRTEGEYILNMQMAGLLIGGFIWGIIADKYGRIKVLFGSIFLYSIGNIANGFVTDVHTYAIIRLVTGIGLAGELGAGITLIGEAMPTKKRGYGTMIVATIGVLGAAAAFAIADNFSWRNAYFVGGAMGIVLLLFRVGVLESGLYATASKLNIVRGKFSIIFAKKERFLRYIYCLLLGLPFWYIVGILITQAPEVGKALGAKEDLVAGEGIMYAYIGLATGEVVSSLLSQITKSRRLTIVAFQIFSFIVVSLYLSSEGITQKAFGYLSFIIGISTGYWVTFVTMASEQFGTNLRATVTTTAPNFVRGSLIPITFLFEFLLHQTSSYITAAYITLGVVTAASIFAVTQLKESFGKDLNYFEE